jgi:predicted ester cyclase
MKNSLATVIGVAALAIGAHQGLAAKKQSNRQVIDHWFEIVDGKKLDQLAEVEAADLVFTTPMGTLKGPAGHKQLLTGFATAFPNYKHTLKRCVESGDLISCEGVWSGDHTGPMTMPDGKTIPATRKHVDLPFIGLGRVKAGKVAEMNVAMDMMSFMMQLGLIPAPPKADGKTASR